MHWLAAAMGFGGAGFVLGLLCAAWKPLPGFAVNASLIAVGAALAAGLGLWALADNNRVAGHPQQDAPRGLGSGFTLIELLVAIAIVALLIGILVPVVGAARRAGEVSATTQFMQNIAMAVSVYHDDLDAYPASDYRQTTGVMRDWQWNGGEIIVEAMMGHMPAADDGKDGLGFRVGNRQYGPYITTGDKEDLADSPVAGEYRKTFNDYWGKPICYYRASLSGSTGAFFNYPPPDADSDVVGTPVPEADRVWGSGGRFRTTDNAGLSDAQDVTRRWTEILPTWKEPVPGRAASEAFEIGLRTSHAFFASPGPDSKWGTEDDITATVP